MRWLCSGALDAAHCTHAPAQWETDEIRNLKDFMYCDNRKLLTSCLELRARDAERVTELINVLI